MLEVGAAHACESLQICVCKSRCQSVCTRAFRDSCISALFCVQEGGSLVYLSIDDKHWLRSSLM